MALPKTLHPALTPDELTFLAENDHINIVPLFSMTRVRLISGIYGPFRPPSASRVPLWLGLSLKKKRKCRIVPPEWLSVERLQAFLKDEKENAEGFERLPRRFMEISKILLDVASDDLSQPPLLRSLLKDIREVRQAKIRMGLQSEDVLQNDYLQVTNLTPLELCELKPFLVRAMGLMQTLRPPEEEEEEE
ncbi:DNA replication complex GINS protein PSF2 [Cryptococcus deuterogattii 99/473]|uniref:DNA replication complex GINS protein PSF2 n=1 Tax=Cryptococcus deuterogattii Ram5 TaxID=1296110 RepID=A0A0D0VEQ4_9TREE|nr:DNA replication complex GINS protein PSF2 [Cryptococcus deuterogattii LA55]KIR43355.1 DNA replication complex GINS protein PSF2 [Cryptococcus deuterogattii Ram5]KIR92385.1 DNA replication complex GINS protein PSF2 [Cryptococcus deuterogattii CBS 10090]KIS01551.1 DNA replication complex GINS protein PSF2 [Cryptococcus deuterogattii 2001/935-1]KIY57229.1 DNA replication complex GINS protein PSF2 [Cryptococcus deuterogattii 99/473]